MIDTIPAFVQPSVASGAVFIGLVVGLCVGWVLAVRKVAPGAVRGFGAALLLWLAITAGWSMALDRWHLLPLFLGFFAASNGMGLVLALSPLGRRLAALPLSLTVGFQAFRVPLEVVLHRWGQEGVIPVEMTWEGYNLDVLSGVICGLAGLWLWRQPQSRAVAWVANSVGLALLLNVAFTAVNSSPLTFARYAADPPLLLALVVPWCWIVPICVASALAGHVLVFRRLLGGATSPLDGAPRVA
ncbi:MAG: hypothetical protein ACI8PZ_007329 [Myxococcota bacterium]